MEKLIEKKKHDHKLTNWLKVLIFSMVMLAPFFAVISKVIYVQSNQNAKDSYYGQAINTSETKYVSLPQLNTLTYLSPNTITTSQSGSFNKRFYYSYAELVGTNIDLSSGDSFRLYTNSQGNIEVLVYSGTTQIGDYYVTRDGYLFEFILNDIADYTTQSTIDISNYTLFYYVTYNQHSYLDNVFYYAVDQLHENQLFNWAKNTGIYNAINSMTTGLDMGANNTLALLLAYWSILIAVYIVFDIIIFIFTKITHFINE